MNDQLASASNKDMSKNTPTSMGRITNIHSCINNLLIKAKNLLTYGCNFGTHATDKRKIFNLNLAAIIAFISISFYSMVYLLTANTALIKAALIHIPFTIIFLSVPWICKRGYLAFARWAFCFSLPAVIFSVLFFIEGNYLEMHYYLLLTGLVPVLVFPQRHWRAIVFLYILNIGLFIYVAQGFITPDPALLTLPHLTVKIMQYVFQYSGLITLLLIIYLSEQVAMNNELKFEALSSTDPLTGLWNRRGLEFRFSDCMAQCSRSDEYGAILVLDMDKFKTLNDQHGHDVGDLFLQAVSRRIKDNLRKIDVLARLGGDEFVVLMSHLSSDKEEAVLRAMNIAGKIRDALSKDFNIPLHRNRETSRIIHRCSASIGVAVFSKNSSWDKVFYQADHAMFNAKKNGRNSACLYQE